MFLCFTPESVKSSHGVYRKCFFKVLYLSIKRDFVEKLQKYLLNYYPQDIL